MALDKNDIAKRIAKEVKDKYFVNLGIGIPTLVANYVRHDISVEFQSENGVLGMGPFPFEGEEDADLINDHINVKIGLDDPQTNPKIPALLNKLKKGIKLGLSVGGKITASRDEFNKELNKKIKVIDGVKLYEISVVGIPSNADAFLSIPQAITKSAKSLNNNKCYCCYSELSKGVCNLCLWKKI